MKKDQVPEEYSYIAFLSYRHLPLDKEAATQIQKRIESFTVPKELRGENDSKRLGRCFRDEDELPASSSLSDSIYYALDHSEFLIVICTPDLPKSKWCLAEISYFLKTHDRDHILLVLADGSPEESFPPVLLHDYDENGQIVSDREPLAANIAGENHTIRKKTVRKESVRICAALLHCPFDTLWQREKRSRAYHMFAMAAAGLAVLAVFLVVLLNRNAQIEAVNLQLQRQLSSAMVDTGNASLQNHDVDTALSSALTAMENEDPRICDPRVHRLLADALGADRINEIQSNLIHEQSTGIERVSVSDDGRFAVFLDQRNNLCCLNLETKTVLWEQPVSKLNLMLHLDNLGDRLLYTTDEGVRCLSLDDGKECWSYLLDDEEGIALPALSSDGSLIAVLQRKDDHSDLPWDEIPPVLIFLNTADGTEAGHVLLPKSEEFKYNLDTWDISPEKMAAAFSKDGQKLACCLCTQTENTYVLCTVNLSDFSLNNAVSFVSENQKFFYGIDVDAKTGQVFFSGLREAGGGVSTNSIYTMTASWESGTPQIAEENIRYDLPATQYMMVYRPEDNACFLVSTADYEIIFSSFSILRFDKTTGLLQRTDMLDSKILNAWCLDPEKNSVELVIESGFDLRYIAGKNELMPVMQQLDANSLRAAVPVNGGTWQNTQTGSFLLVPDEAPQQLLQSRRRTDPSTTTLTIPDPNLQVIEHVELSSDEKELRIWYYSNEGIQLAVLDPSSGSLIRNGHYDDDLFLLADDVISDDCRIFSEDTVYYPDGTTKPALPEDNPFLTEEDDDEWYLEWYLEQQLRYASQADGQILSWADCYFFDLESDPLSGWMEQHHISEDMLPFDLYDLHFFPVWLEGRLLPASLDAETALILYRDDANDEYDLTEAGKNGLLIGYGYRVYIEEDVVSAEDTPKFHFYDVLSGRTVSMENPYPNSRPSILSGNRENAAAVSFDNGHLCLFSYDTETLREVPVVYRAQEVTDFCFSDDDRYLLVITANGHLDIFETATMERKFNETVEELTALVSGNREYDELTGEKNFISSIDARIDPDDAVLYVSVGTSVEQRGLAVNTDTWLVDQILLKEDISGISPLPAVQNNRIYQFPNSYQTEFYSCPIYSTTDLKAWAEKELREK